MQHSIDPPKKPLWQQQTNLYVDAKLFEDVGFVIEATAAEAFFLWKENDATPVVVWEEVSTGVAVVIDEKYDRPVVVSVSYAILNGTKVAFYYGCSSLVDHTAILDWVKYHTDGIKRDGGTRWAHTDAMNFHHCTNHILEKAND